MPDREIDDLLLDLRELVSPAGSEAIAEARLVERLDRTFSRDNRSLRGAFRTARRTMLAIVATGGVVVGAATTGAIALAAMPADSDEQRIAFEAANPTHIAYAAVAKSTAKPDAELRSVFHVLTRRFADVDAAKSRGITAADGTKAWVIPGTAHTCFGADNDNGTGYSCVSNARAAVGALSSAAVERDGQVRAIYLVPDDVAEVSADGHAVKPTNNLAVLRFPAGSVVTVTTVTGGTTAMNYE